MLDTDIGYLSIAPFPTAISYAGRVKPPCTTFGKHVALETGIMLPAYTEELSNRSTVDNMLPKKEITLIIHKQHVSSNMLLKTFQQTPG